MTVQSGLVMTQKTCLTRRYLKNSSVGVEETAFFPSNTSRGMHE